MQAAQAYPVAEQRQALRHPVLVHPERPAHRQRRPLDRQVGVQPEQHVGLDARGEQAAQLVRRLHVQPVVGQPQLGVGLAGPAQRHRHPRQQVGDVRVLARRRHLEPVHVPGQDPQQLGVGVGLDGVVQLRGAQRPPYGRDVLVQRGQVIEVGGDLGKACGGFLDARADHASGFAIGT